MGKMWGGGAVQEVHIGEQRAIDRSSASEQLSELAGCHSYILELTVHPSNRKVKVIQR